MMRSRRSCRDGAVLLRLRRDPGPPVVPSVARVFLFSPPCFSGSAFFRTRGRDRCVVRGRLARLGVGVVRRTDAMRCDAMRCDTVRCCSASACVRGWSTTRHARTSGEMGICNWTMPGGGPLGKAESYALDCDSGERYWCWLLTGGALQ